MPTYDYKCNDCGAIFEAVHGMTETPVLQCPSCSSHNVEKKMTFGGGIVFKGSGFHVNDYGKKKKEEGPAGGSETPKVATETVKSSGHVCHGNCKH